MTKTLTRLIILLPLLLAPLAHAGVEEEFEQGARAHRSMDYASAYRIWLSLAEKGQVDAQYNVARMLLDGDGTPRNYAEALKWFRKAAAQGDRESPYYIGLMYLRGEGVLASESEAQKWFAMNRQHHSLHHDHAQWQKWQQQLAHMNQGMAHP